MIIMLSRNKPRTDTPSLSDEFFNFRIYGTPITVQFYDRNHKMSPDLTRRCLTQAASVCNARHITGMDHTAVGTRALSYSASTTTQSVHLELSPQPQLTWGMWTKVVTSIFIVQGYVEYNELYFIIISELSPGSHRTDGVGRMWETSR